MHDLTELKEKWKNSALELREAEALINLLVIDNNRISRLEDNIQSVFDDLFEGRLKVRTSGNMTDWVDADDWLNEMLNP